MVPGLEGGSPPVGLLGSGGGEDRSRWCTSWRGSRRRVLVSLCFLPALTRASWDTGVRWWLSIPIVTGITWANLCRVCSVDIRGAALAARSLWPGGGTIHEMYGGGPSGVSCQGFLVAFTSAAKTWYILQILSFDCFTSFCASVQLLENTSEECAWGVARQHEMHSGYSSSTVIVTVRGGGLCV